MTAAGRSRAPAPSFVTLPPDPNAPATLLDFLDHRFPRVGRAVWVERFARSAVEADDGSPVAADRAYQPHLRLRYYREVEAEEPFPFEEVIVYRDDDLLAACKPHFLPVTPSGPYVNECLLYRLRRRAGCPGLVPLHRLDRETAGLVLFSPTERHRAGLYEAFKQGRVRKEYEAIAALPAAGGGPEWSVESRIVPGPSWFLSAESDGPANARSRIRLVETRGNLGRYRIDLLTGKRHQARLHLCRIGAPIVNDWLYPRPREAPKAGFDLPLLLLARRVSILHPATGRELALESTRHLDWPAY